MRTRTWLATVVMAGLLAAPVLAIAEETTDVAGDWNISWQSRQGERTMVASFAQDGEKLTGAMTGPQGRAMPLTGSIEGNAITFTVHFQSQRGEFEITYKGTVEGDAMTGTAQTPQNTMEWTGQRKQ